eukprot:1188925-Prorocentrum_minimum.AAC.3
MGDIHAAGEGAPGRTPPPRAPGGTGSPPAQLSPPRTAVSAPARATAAVDLVSGTSDWTVDARRCTRGALDRTVYARRCPRGTSDRTANSARSALASTRGYPPPQI